MYFPWVGMLQQIRLCDTYVYYNDVQFSRGFFNRVQIKTHQGVSWLTVPLQKWSRGQLINDVKIDNSQNWKQRHCDQLRKAYSGAPFFREMIELVNEVFARDYEMISEVAVASTDVLVRYFEALGADTKFLVSSDLHITGSSSQRIIDTCKALEATTYLTGHGARHYLNHEGFEEYGIEVVYIDYELDHYPQLHGQFTPFVSALDLVANCGKEGFRYIRGKQVPWRSFLSRSKQQDGDT